MRIHGYCNMYLRDDPDPYRVPLDQYDRVSSLIGQRSGPVEIPLFYGSRLTCLAENIMAICDYTPEVLETMSGQDAIAKTAELTE